jgi:hypothetical protein
MNKRTLESSPLILSIVIACGAFLPGAIEAQRGPSSTFGAGAASTQPSAAPNGSSRGGESAFGGGSSWGSGKGSFNSSAQPGGIWSDGSTLKAARRAGPPSASASDALLHNGELSAGHTFAKPAGVSMNPVFGVAHSSRPSAGFRIGSAGSGGASAFKASDKLFGAARSKRKAGLLGQNAGKRVSRPSSTTGIDTMQQTPRYLPEGASPFSEDTPDTAIRKPRVDGLP